MDFQRFALKYINSNMYIGLDRDVAIIVDPNVNEEGLSFLNQKDITKALILLTHEHFDHTTGVNKVREFFPCTLVCHTECAKSIAMARKNRPLTLLLLQTTESPVEMRRFFDSFPLYTCMADITFDDAYGFVWGGHKFNIFSTPGHSKGSVCIEIDETWVFTGDSLIPDTPVITRYPGGSMEEYKSITLPYLSNIPDTRMIMPGHGLPCLKKELLHNC